MYTSIHIYLYIYIHLHTYVDIRISHHMHRYTNICTYIYVYIRKISYKISYICIVCSGYNGHIHYMCSVLYFTSYIFYARIYICMIFHTYVLSAAVTTVIHTMCVVYCISPLIYCMRVFTYV